MSGWRVWFAFEVRPGVTRTSQQDLREHWRGLAAACRQPDGKLDAAEYDRWLECMVEHAHLWGST